MNASSSGSNQLIIDDAKWLSDNLRRNQLVMHLFWIAHADKADAAVRAMDYETRRAIELREGCGCIGAWLMWRSGFDMEKFVTRHEDPAFVMTREIAHRWKTPERDTYKLLHPWDRSPDGEPNPWWPGDYIGYKEEAVEAMRRFAATL